MKALFLLLIYCSTGEAHSVKALVGDDVTLVFNTTKSTDIGKETVEWSRTDLSPDIVHLRENGRPVYEEQNPAYRGRTMLSAGDLKRGLISLTLFSVRLADGGNYTCRFAAFSNKYTIQLQVGAASSPIMFLEAVNSSALVLGCRSSGWYPRPQLSWVHTEGAPLPIVTMTTQDPNRLYDISSTVVLKGSPSRPLICRVHQDHFNQTRETEMHIPENFFVVRRCRTIPGVLTVMGILMCLSFVILYRNTWRVQESSSDKEEGLSSA